MGTLGRNDPCHCGSGRKYKDCHWRTDRLLASQFARRPRPTERGKLPPEVIARIEQIEARRKERFTLYGDVRDIVHTDFQGYKFVAVWHELHYSKKWKTFPDFLFSYIKTALNRAFGSKWAAQELQKPPADRHPILRWYDALCTLQAKSAAEADRRPDGTFESELDGPSAAYLALAYDLYILAHHNLLESSVVQRLRDRNSFRAARYELLVMATVLRAGFEIVPEDEHDSSTKHPEFVASHKRLPQKLAVEAKSKWRPGVIEWKLEDRIPEEFRLNIRDLIDSAIEKAGEDPLCVFIDANMPPDIAWEKQATWLAEVHGELVRAAYKGFSDVGVFEGAPYAALVLTNIPHDYAAPGERDPGKICYMVVPERARVPLRHPELLGDIERAIKQYGKVPQEFPELGGGTA